MDDNSHDRNEEWRTATDEFTSGKSVPQDAAWDLVAQEPYDQGTAEGLTTTIIAAVAQAEGRSLTEVKEPPLYEVVDAAALEAALFGSKRNSRVRDRHVSTEFMYRGFRVVIRSDGWVLVYEQLER